MSDPVRQRYALATGKGIGAHPAESKPTTAVRYAKGGRVPTTTVTHKAAHTAKGFKKHPWKS